MRAHAVLLDFDGLICDTERAARSSWERLYAYFGYEFPDSVWRLMSGHAAGHEVAEADLSRRLERPLARSELRLRSELKRWLADAEPVRPGVIALLDAAAELGFTRIVVSNSRWEWVAHHLDRLGVRARFDLLVTGELTAAKPAPDLYLRALDLAGVAAWDAVAFEDSAAGVAAAKAAGVRCVAVPGHVGDPASLGAADLVLPCLTHFVLSAERTAAR